MSIATRYRGRETRAKIIAGNEPSWITKHPRATYVRQGYLSLLPWVDRDELDWLNWCRLAWSAAIGIEYVFDHLIPINHLYVTGLTVPWNLRLVPRAVNATKLGEWHPDQGELPL